jgi:hypothetical protein
MTLNEFATFSTAVSGLAVTASLIYLALQTHQNAKHTKALIHQGRLANTMELTSAFLDPRIAAIILRKNGDEPTEAAIADMQFAVIFSRTRQNWEDTYVQHRNGLLEPETFATTRGRIVSVLSQPGYRAEWEKTKIRGTRFTAFVDAIVATLPAAPQPVDPL